MIIEDIQIKLNIDRIEQVETHMVKLIEYLEEIRKDLQDRCKHSRTRDDIKNGKSVESCVYCGEDLTK